MMKGSGISSADVDLSLQENKSTVNYPQETQLDTRNSTISRQSAKIDVNLDDVVRAAQIAYAKQDVHSLPLKRSTEKKTDSGSDSVVGDKLARLANNASNARATSSLDSKIGGTLRPRHHSPWQGSTSSHIPHSFDMNDPPFNNSNHRTTHSPASLLQISATQPSGIPRASNAAAPMSNINSAVGLLPPRRDSLPLLTRQKSSTLGAMQDPSSSRVAQSASHPSHMSSFLLKSAVGCRSSSAFLSEQPSSTTTSAIDSLRVRQQLSADVSPRSLLEEASAAFNGPNGGAAATFGDLQKVGSRAFNSTPMLAGDTNSALFRDMRSGSLSEPSSLALARRLLQEGSVLPGALSTTLRPAEALRSTEALTSLSQQSMLPRSLHGDAPLDSRLSLLERAKLGLPGVTSDPSMLKDLTLLGNHHHHYQRRMSAPSVPQSLRRSPLTVYEQGRSHSTLLNTQALANLPLQDDRRLALLRQSSAPSISDPFLGSDVSASNFLHRNDFLTDALKDESLLTASNMATSSSSLAWENPGSEVHVPESFPVKLHRILCELEKVPGGTDIACFLPHGRAFMIRDTQLFEASVMKKYYRRMSRFASFQRQLNLYDFQRILKGRDKGAYYHKLFLKQKPDLAKRMRRTKIKGENSLRNPNNKHLQQQEEIDFYNMAPPGEDDTEAKAMDTSTHSKE